MLTLVLWQHVAFLRVRRTLFRMSLAMVVRLMLCIYDGKSKIIRTLVFPIYLHKWRPEQVRHFST